MRHRQIRQILILVVIVLSLFVIQEMILTTHPANTKPNDTTISSTSPETTTPKNPTKPPDDPPQTVIHHPPSSLPVINNAEDLVMVEFEKLLAEDNYQEKVFKNFTSPKPIAYGDCKFTKLYDAPTISPLPINHPIDTDFTNTPSSKLRPTFTYEYSQFEEPCTGDVQPTLITIVLLYHNQSEYQKMFELIYGQSFQLWQLQIVVPADEEHNHELENEVGDKRVVITHLPSKLWANPPSLKNKILENITTSYLLYWNGQDLLEPTFLEKCIWYLETHSNVPICGSHFISFNGIEEYWNHGYENSSWTLNTSIIHLSPVLRSSDLRTIGGYNMDSIRGLEDWELLLKFGELGYHGFTIQEPLWWYKTPRSRDSLSLLTDEQRDHFVKKFPKIFSEQMLPFNKTNSDVPSWIRAMWKVQYRPRITKKMNFTLPFIQYVPSTYRPRALVVLPFLEMGGSDHYNLEIIKSLYQRGWEISIVTTHISSNPFLSDALKYSPDIFLLPNFLEWIDFQRFLCYFLRLRAPDLMLLTNSFVGYQFLPYMDSYCPCHKKPVIVDIVHSFTETWWMNGGYPYMSVHHQQFIDRTISTSQDLSNWMYQRGKDKKNVAVLYLGTNVTMFSLEGMNTTQMKIERKVPLDTKIFLWVGRFHHEKRPQVFVDAARLLLERGINNFYALVIGSGKQLTLVNSVLESNKSVSNNVKLLGELGPDDIKQWMAISDVIVLTSITEGTPLVIFEGLAMQNFILSTNVGAISEQVDPSTGILVDISQINKTRWELESHLFAHEMHRILNIPTSELRNGGEIARKKTVELFNNDYYIDMFINELCTAEREATTRVRPGPVTWDDKKLKELLYNSMRFIML